MGEGDHDALGNPQLKIEDVCVYEREVHPSKKKINTLLKKINK